MDDTGKTLYPRKHCTRYIIGTIPIGKNNSCFSLQGYCFGIETVTTDVDPYA